MEGTVNDTEQIRRAIGRWALLYDLKRDADWIEELLADDIELHEPGDLNIVGKDAVRELLEQPWEGDVRGVHVLGEPVVEIDGDGRTARATTNSTYIMPVGNGCQIYLAGRYDDE